MAEPVITASVFTVVKQVRDDVGQIRRRVEDHDAQFKGILYRLMTIRSDHLRRDAMLAGLCVDLDAIGKRLSLTDP